MYSYKAFFNDNINTLNKTKIKIQRAFLDLYSVKNFERITIKDICVDAHIARTTFYNYYQNTIEVIEEIEDIIIKHILFINNEILNLDISDKKSWDFFKDTISYINKNYNLFYMFLVKQPNIRFINKWKGAIKYHFYNKCLRFSNNIDTGLVIEMISSAIIGGYTYWIINSDNTKIENANEIILAFIHSMEK